MTREEIDKNLSKEDMEYIDMKSSEAIDACAWFKSCGIYSYFDGKEDVYVAINGEDIQVSSSEISYRADLYRGTSVSKHDKGRELQIVEEIKYYDGQMTGIMNALYEESYLANIERAEPSAIDLRRMKITRMLSVYGGLYCKRNSLLNELKGELQ